MLWRDHRGHERYARTRMTAPVPDGAIARYGHTHDVPGYLSGQRANGECILDMKIGVMSWVRTSARDGS